MKRNVALCAGLLLGLLIAEKALAQPAGASSGGRNVTVFNPFASFSLNRFTFNSFGFLQIGSSGSFTSTTSTALSQTGDESPEAVVVRPPYRPPVRSPFRPP